MSEYTKSVKCPYCSTNWTIKPLVHGNLNCTNCDNKIRIPKEPTFKKDWLVFKQKIDDYKISSLFHFTDESNINSISKGGGLFSWKYCEDNNLNIPKPGGGDLSRSLDNRKNLPDYVRLGLNYNLPMLYVALREGRIKNPYIIEIDPMVILWEETLFSDENATANGAIIGSELDDFLNINFDIAMKDKYDESEKKLFQAEILVKTFIPYCFIKTWYCHPSFDNTNTEDIDDDLPF